MLLVLLTFSHLGRNGVFITGGTASETWANRFHQSSSACSQSKFSSQIILSCRFWPRVETDVESLFKKTVFSYSRTVPFSLNGDQPRNLNTRLTDREKHVSPFGGQILEKQCLGKDQQWIQLTHTLADGLLKTCNFLHTISKFTKV